MRVNPYLYGALAVVIMVGVVFAAQSAGFWSTDNKITPGGEKVQADPTNVDTIKGWMTLEDISRVYQVSVPDVLAKFNLPADTPADTSLKTLREKNDSFEIGDLRDWLKARMEPAR
jgi:hypothetical protein